MVEVEKPWEFREEEDAAAAAGGLQTREMRKKKENRAMDLGLGHGTDGEEEEEEEEELPKASEEEEEEEEAQAVLEGEEHKKSIFFDPTRAKVSDQIVEASSEKEVTEVVQTGGEKEIANETSSEEGQEIQKQENVSGQETNHDIINGKSENGSHSNGVHEVSSSSETVSIASGVAGLKLIATIGDSSNSLTNWSGALGISNGSTNRTEVHEIEVEKDEQVTKGEVKVEEYDLQKILDEQETHDLYCPKCHSCITRRVILKKRKRTVRQEIHEATQKKTHLIEPSAPDSDEVPAGRPDPPEVFRCLSCFTFFIPTGCGFNIFRIFERRDPTQNVEFRHPSAPYALNENCGSWLISCFQTVDSPKSAGEDPTNEPLLSGPKSTDVQTTKTKKEEIEQSFTGSHGTTSSSVTVQSSSTSVTVETLSSTSKISSGQSETIHPELTFRCGEKSNKEVEPSYAGSVQTGAGLSAAAQQGTHEDQIPVSKPAGSTVTYSIHDRDEGIQGNTTAASKNSFQENFNPEIKVPTAGPTKSSPEVGNLAGLKLTSVGPQPIQSGPQPHVAVPVPDAAVPVAPVPAPAQRDDWDILKAIVYGGLVESITSLSVVSAAAASGSKTLDIFILGMANLIGGLPLIFHNIADLKNLGDVNANDERVGHYWLQLGRRSKYRLHMVIALLSYILFGLLPPVIYGFTFRKSDNRENKMMVVAAASLACVALLALGKAHVKRPRTYITTLLYYLSMGLSASGLSYVAGVLITRLLAHFGLIDQGGSAPSAAPAPPGLMYPGAMGAEATAWASF
ncbi:hypothetical protein ACP4OV_017063 [Aristida adscensionis]